MRIIIAGATGTIGKAVAEALSERHEVLRAGLTRGDYQADILSKESLRRLFEATAPFDAIVSTTGQARFGDLTALTDEDFDFSLSHKLMGQVNLLRIGLEYVRDGGSITLTGGVLAHEPMPGSAAISLVNAGLEGFVQAAALQAPRGIRLNLVSPPWVSETLEAMGNDGARGYPASVVARAYVDSVEGEANGAVIDARNYEG